MRDLLTIAYPETLDRARAEGLRIVIDVETGRPTYACPDPDWSAHLTAWRRRIQILDKSDPARNLLPEPMPYGHLLFDRPHSYGYVRDGDARPAARRRAIRARVVGPLQGYDRDLRKTPEGMRELARIVRATVSAKVAGQDTGAWPFMACIRSWL